MNQPGDKPLERMGVAELNARLRALSIIDPKKLSADENAVWRTACIEAAEIVWAQRPPTAAQGETPRTDAVAIGHGALRGQTVDADFARQLERESSEFQRCAEGWKQRAERAEAGLTEARKLSDASLMKEAAALEQLEEVRQEREFTQKELDYWKEKAAVSASEEIPEGCTVADAQLLRKANGDLADESHRLQVALRNLLKQVDDFCATEGEANFYTGEAVEVLARTERGET